MSDIRRRRPIIEGVDDERTPGQMDVKAPVVPKRPEFGTKSDARIIPDQPHIDGRSKHLNRRKADQALKIEFLMKMRRAGATYAQIAEAAPEHIGVTMTQSAWSRLAQRAYQRLSKQLVMDTAAAVAGEVDFLEGLMRQLMPRVTQGDVQAIAEARKLADQRAKLLGLYQEPGTNVFVGGQHVHMTQDDLLAAGRERAAKLRALPEPKAG